MEREITLDCGGVRLAGALSMPAQAKGVVLFAHGSGSSRHSPRNRFVAGAIEGGGLATLLMDLLTEDEEFADQVSGRYRFDIPRLGERLVCAADWLDAEATTARLPIGCFGASTGAAAALIAAAERPALVKAVVSRGGRPDLAGAYLSRVRAPTLLIVGGADPVVIDLNRQAMTSMTADKRLEIVPGATHLFEERGALERVAELARDWLLRHLSVPAR